MKKKKLSDNQRLVCAAFQLNSELSYSEVAQMTQLPEHVVRYCLSSLRDQGRLYRTPLINFYALGIQEYVLYFSLTDEAKNLAPEIELFFSKTIPTTWFGPLHPHAEYLAVVLAHTPLEFATHLRRLSEAFGSVFKNKCHEAVTRYTYFGRRFVTPFPVTLSPVVLEPPSETHQIDLLDEQILNRLACFEQNSVREIAKDLNESHSTVDYRIRKLKEKGIIAAMILSAAELVDRILPYRIRIFAGGASPKTTEALYAFCKRELNVIGFLEVAASWDYTIRIEVENAAALDPILERLAETIGNPLKFLVDSPGKALKHLTFPLRNDTLSKN